MRSLSNFRTAAITSAALLLGLSMPAAIGAPATTGVNLPQPVGAWLAQAKQDCPAGFQSDNPIETLDLTGDGRPGYIANPHRLSCAGEPHIFVGDGPASIELFVTLPSGEVVHTGGVRALGYQIMPSPQGGAPILAFQTHEDNERAGSIDTYRWDGHNFTLLNKAPMSAPPVDGPDREYQK